MNKLLKKFHNFFQVNTKLMANKEILLFLIYFPGIHPTKCDPFFANIVSCMADGKNHVPCCERNNVPDVCQDMCVGEYTEQTDDVRTHLSCGAFTAPTLACISEGVGK